MRQTSHTAAPGEPPPPGDALDELREQFPHRQIWRGRRSNDVDDQRTGDYYASTSRNFSDFELGHGGVKTVVASSPQELRKLLAQQPDMPPGEG